MIAFKEKETFKETEIKELISIFFQTILKEVVDFARRFPEAEIYINQSEPFLYIEIVYDYIKLSGEDEKYFFGLEYRLNKEIKSVLGENAPYIEVYIGVHAVDYVLAEQFDIEDIATHRGRKRRITENMDWDTSENFAKLLTYSLAIRYNEISSEEIIQKMKESLADLISHLTNKYDFPVQLKRTIFEKTDINKT